MTLVANGAIQRSWRAWHAWWLVILVASFVLTAIVPSFQAPDEIDHVRRAVLLADGYLVIQKMDGSPSGGQVDSGFEAYAQRMFPLGVTLNQRMTADEKAGLSSIRWTGHKQGAYPSGTAYYFPALYVPQAIGLATGRGFGWTISQSYLLARLLSLATAMGILFLAFRIFAPPPLVLALLALPMTLFLLSAAALDGMSTAVAVLALSAYMRVATDRLAPRWISWVLIGSILLVTSCRANTLPFLALPLAGWAATRDRRVLLATLIGVVAVLAWTLFTIKYTGYPEGPSRGGQAGKLVAYLLHPGQFLGPFFETLARAHMRQFLGWSFVGILGWLTVALPTWVYSFAGWALLTLLVLGLARSVFNTARWERLLLIVCAVAATLLTFLALLVQWPQAEPGVINGVQGRYLLIPALAAAYALSAPASWMSGLRRRVALLLVAVIIGVGTFTSVVALVGRYYLDPGALHQDAAAPGTALAASPQLSSSQPIMLHFDEAQRTHPKNLIRLSVDMATYARTNDGEATLRLKTADGQVSTHVIDLAALTDNAYAMFLLDGKPYVSGDIVVTSGAGGISAWEARAADGTTLTCMKYSAIGGDAVLTPACPIPVP